MKYNEIILVLCLDCCLWTSGICFHPMHVPIPLHRTLLSRRQKKDIKLLEKIFNIPVASTIDHKLLVLSFINSNGFKSRLY